MTLTTRSTTLSKHNLSQNLLVMLFQEGKGVLSYMLQDLCCKGQLLYYAGNSGASVMQYIFRESFTVYLLANQNTSHTSTTPTICFFQAVLDTSAG